MSVIQHADLQAGVVQALHSGQTTFRTAYTSHLCSLAA